MKSNCYRCNTCYGRTVTINDDCGVTPFIIGCKATPSCTGLMYSSFGIVKPTDPAPTYEWYRCDNSKQLKGLEKEHHDKGGALLRKIKGNNRPNRPLSILPKRER